MDSPLPDEEYLPDDQYSAVEPGRSQASGVGGPIELVDAAREALNRARAAARERGAAPDAVRRPWAPSQTRSGAGPDGRDPMLLGDSVRGLVRDQGWTTPTAVAGVLGRWPEIVGAEVAAHVQPEAFDEKTGRLVLRADSTSWASAMKLHVPKVLQRVAADVGANIVKTVTVLGPAAPSWKHGPLAVPGRGPRDTYG
jgi:predicted nucleic acid-binding Zn ribbon protein